MTFSQDVRKYVFLAQNGYCGIPGCLTKIAEFHHKFANYERRNKQYPLFMQSPMNCIGLCKFHHDNYSSFDEAKLSERYAELYEWYLRTVIKEGK